MTGASLTTQFMALALALLPALAVFLLGRRFGDRLWAVIWRRGQEDAEWVHASLSAMFRELPLDRCRLMVRGASLLALLLLAFLTWSLSWPVTVGFSVLAAWLAGRLPRRVVEHLRRRYVARFEDQLTDSLTMLASALRSGLSLPQGLDLVAREMPAPMSQEIGLVLNQQKMGMSLDQALEELGRRIDSDDLALVVNAVLILRETGGNLSETFDTIVHTISERDKVRGKIRTLTAQGVAQGMILTAMPFVLAWVLHLINPDYLRPMFTSVLGWIMLGFMALLLAVGGMMIRKIVTIDV